MADVKMPEGFDPKQVHVKQQWKHDSPLVACRFDPMGRFVFTGAEDNSVQRFDLKDGKRIVLKGGHKTWVRAMSFSNDGKFLISGGCEGDLTWWETATAEPKPIRTISAHKGWIRAMEVSPDGTLIASAGNDTVVRIWNVADGKLVREFPGHARDIYSVAFHPGGKLLLSGDLMGVIKQWDIATGKEVRSFDAKELHSYNGGQRIDFGGVRAIAFSPDGKSMTAGGLYKATNPLGAVHQPLLLQFDWTTGKKIRNQISDAAEKGVIWRLRYVADGSLMGVCGGSSGGYLFFWKSDADKSFHKFKLPSLARDMDLHVDGLQVCSAHHDKQVRVSQLSKKA
jgi:WD40 repeat protein